ncbi:hypothetical protein CUMW_241060 [Citrus unshiu]|uniref:Uncharacterized protein n=1 Tax=Citrus unshiu TaxID=55188 RepID=A0A2H5QLD3_CITUN|nr:hypothetical protein CUMW_241060 [Citrus unshiu]GAY65433.1 hypothetical protein CUMW_241060 [Citrus unshiu]
MKVYSQLWNIMFVNPTTVVNELLLCEFFIQDNESFCLLYLLAISFLPYVIKSPTIKLLLGADQVLCVCQAPIGRL